MQELYFYYVKFLSSAALTPTTLELKYDSVFNPFICWDAE